MKNSDLERLSKVSDKVFQVIPEDKLLQLTEYEGKLFATHNNADLYPFLFGAYYLATQNIIDKSVIRYLFNINDLSIIEELVQYEFMPLAIKQFKKTEFANIVKIEMKKYKQILKEQSLEEQKLSLQADRESNPLYYGKTLSKSIVESILNQNFATIRLNLVTNKTEITAQGQVFENYSKENLTNILPSIIYDVCKENNVKGLSNGLKLINTYLFTIADENRYNPILDMLEEYKNQDPSHLENMFEILGITKPLYKTFLKKWLIQCVALAHNNIDNPISAEGVLVLQGKQSIGKTSFFRKLSVNPQWFVEGATIDTRQKDTVIRALSGWICELGELDSTLKKEQSELKAFITQPKDSIRLPYAVNATDAPRRTSFCGTVNEETFLKDTTGNRRYWIIPLESIDKNRLFNLSNEDVFKLWGYVQHLYELDNKAFRLDDEQLQELNIKNTYFQSELRYEQEVRHLLNWTLPLDRWERFAPAEIAEYFNTNNICKPNAEQVGRVLTRICEEETDVVKTRCAKGYLYLLPLNHYHLEAYKAKLKTGCK